MLPTDSRVDRFATASKNLKDTQAKAQEVFDDKKHKRDLQRQKERREELKTLDRDRVFFAHDILAQRPRRDWVQAAIDRLPDKVYVTIDLDAFDPSILPATGTPEPGGLDWRTVNAFVSRLAQRRRIVGFDVVELLPDPVLQACDFLAAKLVLRVMAEILSGRD